MRIITNEFKKALVPFKATVYYKGKGDYEAEYYVEQYDVTQAGVLSNGRALSMKEANTLGKILIGSEDKNNHLQPSGVAPTNVLHWQASGMGNVIWFTQKQWVQMHFVDSIKIAPGKAHIPALLWKANKEGVQVFALDSNRRPTIKTRLYHAPFPNIYEDGRVCMGNVKLLMPSNLNLQNFTKQWQDHFFNSAFSQVLFNGLKEPLIPFWRGHMATLAQFPVDALKPTRLTLKELLCEY